MIVQTKFRIKIKGLEDYRVCENGMLWKLDVVDSIGRFLKPRRITKDETRDAYRIGRKYYSAKKIEANLTEEDDQEQNERGKAAQLLEIYAGFMI